MYLLKSFAKRRKLSSQKQICLIQKHKIVEKKYTKKKQYFYQQQDEIHFKLSDSKDSEIVELDEGHYK